MSCKIAFNNLYYYHVFNRGVDKRQVFLDRWDYGGGYREHAGV